MSAPSAVRLLGALAERTIPPPAVEQAVDRLLDFVGLCLLASRRPEVELVRAHARDPDGTAGRHGGIERLTARAEALVNGTAVHATGLDDFHRPTAVHPMATVVAAALAAAGAAGATGRQCLEAIVVGYEVACRLGRSVPTGALHHRGFHPTSVFGTVAAAASAAAAMGLDGESTGRAIALAATRAAGLVHFGSKAWTKALQAGWAAAAGYDAAALARRGFEAPAGILEERGGLLFAVAGADGFDPSSLGRPDSCWAISEVSYKPYAHSTDLHAAVDAVLDVCRTSGLTASEIASVEVGLTKGVFDATAGGDRERHQPVTVRAAQQSVYFVVAVALGAYRPDVGVQTFHEWFTESRLGDPTVLDLATRVTATVDPTLDEVRPHASPASVIIKARDGRRLAGRVADHRGAPGRPFDREDLKRRLRHFTSEAERAILAIEALPGASSIEGVGSLLRQAPDVH